MHVDMQLLVRHQTITLPRGTVEVEPLPVGPTEMRVATHIARKAAGRNKRKRKQEDVRRRTRSHTP